MKAERFQPIKERFSKRLTNWSEKYMSSGAKDVLIKSVAQALPTYVMGMFKMTNQFCDDYMQLVRNFWWGHDSEHRKVHWLAWDKLTCPKSFGGLGFRDMKCFNQALLARQSWRLLVAPESLCARVLKAKYFPNGSLLDTAFPTAGSPTWKGIEYGIELLRRGIVWRIGDGNSVKIWRHRWVGHGDMLEPIVKKRWNRLTYVSELMVTGTKQWDENRVRLLTVEGDANAILRINIPQMEREDSPAWYYEQSGMFTVKSAYRLAWSHSDLAIRHQATSTSPNGERKIWEVLWKTKVQPKIRIFGWQLAHDSLPTGKNKWKRTLEIINVCKLCGQREEDGYHATVACTRARALREEMRKVWALPAEKHFKYTGRDWLLILLHGLSPEMRANVLMLLWRAWHLRNDAIHVKGEASIQESVNFLVRYSAELLPVRPQENSKGKAPMFTEEAIAKQRYVADTRLKGWSAPPEGWAKINVDGAFLTESGDAAIGVVARDCRGLVLYTCHERISQRRCATEVEAHAVLEGIKIARDLVQMPVVVESDSEVIIRDLMNPSRNRAIWSPTIEETLCISRNLDKVQWRHVKRADNRVAHELCQMGLRTRQRAVWTLDAPSNVAALIAQDCNTLFI
jgi:ribonuclease HI